MQYITAFIDGSDCANSVLDHAVWAASRLEMPVATVHVMDDRDDGPDQPADLSGSMKLGERTALLEQFAKADGKRATSNRAFGRAILDDAEARIRDTDPEIEIASKLRHDDLVAAVKELADETRFAIIGKRGETVGPAKDHLGSNLESLVRTSTRPTLVVPSEFKPIQRFLLAFDGGPSAQRAIDRLMDGSVLDGTHCHIISVGAPNSDVGKKLDAAAQTLRDAGYTVTDLLMQGDPGTAISKAIVETDSDILVLGKSGHSRIRQFFIGSTTLELMQNCDVPVLVFP